MKSPFVMMMNSAVPLQTKRSAPHLGGKEETALRNWHRDFQKEEVVEILSKFLQKMKNSGYNHKLREQVINAGTIAHREDIGRCKRGEKEDVPIQERKVRPEEIEPRKPKVMEEGESWSTRPHDVYKSSVHCRLKVG